MSAGDGVGASSEDGKGFSEKLITQNETNKERLNQSNYRQLFSDLLSRQKGLLSKTVEHPEQYAAELKLIKNILTAEREAILIGVLVGVTAFASFRYLPNYLVKRFGGETKANALREAENMSRTQEFYYLRTATGLLFEGLFGVWVGHRGYQVAVNQTKGTYEEIAKIPLCEGRSNVAEGMCEEWMQLANTKVPRNFWQIVENEDVSDARTWKAIRQFADNCQKRKIYGTKLIKEQGLNPSEHVAIPSPGVPELMSPETASKLVSDGSG
uniref:Uncharacterized protein n=1 Tax=Attheya septentrionalis TaxID=420275 RepID=A0A7S2UMQ2_9STRA|mmetsp:Transcript_5058/g.8880  ORF Transcript_5058/g.8880 Transcript_5058/m.8880 type:complete len:269 (+) Transcript_5058:230-1036(+)